MTPPARSIEAQHPAPHAHQVRLLESFFSVFGGPIAWITQIGAGYALAALPCVSDGERIAQPAPTALWTTPTLLSLIAITTAISLLSLGLSWRTYRRTQAEMQGDHRHLLETGAGRTRFMALWGMLMGAGFAVANVISAINFVVLPRCGI